MYISCWTLHPDCTLAFLLNSHPINQPYGGFLVHLKTRKRFPWPQKSPHEVLHFGRKYLKRKLCRFTNKPKPKTITFRRAVTMFQSLFLKFVLFLATQVGWRVLVPRRGWVSSEMLLVLRELKSWAWSYLCDNISMDHLWASYPPPCTPTVFLHQHNFF